MAHNDIKGKIIDLTNELMPIERQRKAYEDLANPSLAICGKPGFGYKAAERYRKEAARLSMMESMILFQIDGMINSSRLSRSTKDQRHQYYNDARAQWEINNPLPTIYER